MPGIAHRVANCQMQRYVIIWRDVFFLVLLSELRTGAASLRAFRVFGPTGKAGVPGHEVK